MQEKVYGNRYRIIERIGMGGMAEVYRATDEVLGRTVALKLMLPQYASDPTFAARFKQEAQAAANLQSPYIVNIYDWGHDDADDTYYIVMELVRGTDLKTAINQRGALNQRKAAEIGSQVCAALSVAHGYDIIHRDIKPHNIMVQPDGNAKVMDFGIARANGSGMTQTGSVLGTAYYVSPEQAQGKPLTPATDLYSLGVVLYEAVTGRVPFDGPDAVSVALKQVNELPVPPSQINPDIDLALEAIILKAMSKNPKDRYSTADAMRTALNNFLAGRPIDEGVADGQAATTVMAAMPGAREVHAAPQNPAAGNISQTTVMPNSGTVLPPPVTYQGMPGNSRQPEKKKMKPAAIFGIVAAILVAAFGVFLLVMFLLNPTTAAADIPVPNVVGYSQADAESEIEKANLAVGSINQQASDSVIAGNVISTDPVADTKVSKGSKVNLVISSGPTLPQQVTVPDLTNLTPDAAGKKLDLAGLKYQFGGNEPSDTIVAGNICRQSPEANTVANSGDTVTYYVSSGEGTVQIPNVVGKTKSEAEQILTDAGFTFKYNDPVSSDSVAEDSVVSQSPTNGVMAAKGSEITLTLSSGPEKPEQVTVPSVVGLNADEAAEKIQDAGLKFKITYQDTTDASKVGTVISTDPGSGQSVDAGSTVTLIVGQAASTNGGSSTPPKTGDATKN